MIAGAAKILLVGPCPPPHGGIAVHVATARQRLTEAGVRCCVADLGGFGPALLARIARHARRGWATHVHTHGHSSRSWLVAALCGVAARRAPARLLTVHSGLLPGFLAGAGPKTGRLVRAALGRYDRVVCVNPGIRDALARFAPAVERLAVAPAYLAGAPRGGAAPEGIERFASAGRPLVTATASAQPEYGLDLLLAALVLVVDRFPELSCLVLGVEDEAGTIRREIERRGLERRVLLAGDVDHDLCRALIAGSDLFVRPTFADGDSISVREALAAGVPVVASAVGLRPPGCELFDAGDVGGLAARIENVLVRAESGGARREPTVETDGLDGLLRIYRDIRLEVPRCVPSC